MIEHINQTQLGLLAKLLSKENIRIQHGNYTTAYFDCDSRVLGLPLWKNKGKNVYDLLVGHEVGHALYSFKEDIAKFYVRFPKTPFDVYNIVEDIRIERLIQGTYPGLRASFQKGYSALIADNFFGTNGKNLASMRFLDRLNIFAKAGAYVEVPLSTEEKSLYDLCYAAETGDDALNAVEAIVKYIKSQKPKKPKAVKKPTLPKSSKKEAEKSSQPENPVPPTASNSDDDDESGESEDGAPEEDANSSEKVSKSEDVDEKKSDKPADNIESNSDGESEDTSDESGSPSSSSSDKDGEESESAESDDDTTDENFKSSTAEEYAKNLEKSTESGDVNNYYTGPSDAHVYRQVVPLQDVIAACQNEMRRRITEVKASQSFKDCRARAEKAASILSTQFEMRKAAFRYSRATESKTGSLNLGRLYSYKYDDNIFRSVTRLADAKSHGMMLIVDYSSSMSGQIQNVLEQTLSMITFCKKVGIPYAVYGFTSPAVASTQYQNHKMLWPEALKTSFHTDISLQSLSMFEIASSSGSASEQEFALDRITCMVASNFARFMTGYENMTSTPLNEAVIAAHTLVNDFKKKHSSVQKMNVLFLTDGDGCGMHPVDKRAAGIPAKQSTCTDRAMAKMTLNGRTFPTHSYDSRKQYTSLLENLRITTGATILGFYMTSGWRDASDELSSANYARPDKAQLNTAKLEKMRHAAGIEFKTNGVCATTSAYGFDEYYLIDSGRMSVKSGVPEFAKADVVIDDDASDRRKVSTIAKAFAKFSTNKKQSQKLLSAFAKQIA